MELQLFFHGNGRDTSEIDYILTKCEQNMILKPTTVAENSSSNLSDHTMLSVDIKMDFESHKAQKIKIPARPKWSSCDVQRYKESVRKSIRNSFRSPQTTDSAFDIQCQIRTLTDILRTATESSIPNYKPEIYKKNRQRISIDGVRMFTLLFVIPGRNGANGNELVNLSDLLTQCTLMK